MPINRECPKCGHMEARVRHNRVLDEMEMECPLCKYEWRLKPLDVLRADKERQAASSQDPPCTCTLINEPKWGGFRSDPNCPRHGYQVVQQSAQETSVTPASAPAEPSTSECITGYWFCANCHLCNSETIHHTSCPTCGGLRPTANR